MPPSEPANDNGPIEVPASFAELVREIRVLGTRPSRRRQPSRAELEAYFAWGGKYPLGPSDPWPFGWLP